MTQRIKENTQISRAHLTPEIGLRLITPECRLFHEPIREESEKVFENDPFWGFYWPGGQAISRFDYLEIRCQQLISLIFVHLQIYSGQPQPS